MTVFKVCDSLCLSSLYVFLVFFFFFLYFLRRELNMIHFGGNYIIGCFTVFRTVLIFVLKWHNVLSVSECLSEKREN